jgi:hypothetical protein
MTRQEADRCLYITRNSTNDWCIVETKNGFGVIEIGYHDDDGWGRAYMEDDYRRFLERWKDPKEG